MATLQELDNYYGKLEQALSSKTPSHLVNKDRTHNSTIMRFMFEKSHQVNMYCGEMSVFRRGFYDHIAKDNEDNSLADELKELLKKSFQKFIQNEKNQLSIIFETYDKSYLKDLIFDDSIFENAVKSGRIHLYKLSDNFLLKKDLNHFACTDNGIVRLEHDKVQRSAICTIDSPHFSSVVSNFLSLKKIAEPIEL